MGISPSRVRLSSAQLVRFFSAVDRTHLDSIGEILFDYEGRHRELAADLLAEYGVSPWALEFQSDFEFNRSPRVRGFEFQRAKDGSMAVVQLRSPGWDADAVDVDAPRSGRTMTIPPAPAAPLCRVSCQRRTASSFQASC